jgi:hypothetical protein
MYDLAFDPFGCTDAVFARVRGPPSGLVVLCQELNRFLFKSRNDPILGLAHRQRALCPIPNSHRVVPTTFESQKLVESGTVRLRNDF